MMSVNAGHYVQKRKQEAGLFLFSCLSMSCLSYPWGAASRNRPSSSPLSITCVKTTPATTVTWLDCYAHKREEWTWSLTQDNFYSYRSRITPSMMQLTPRFALVWVRWQRNIQEKSPLKPSHPILPNTHTQDARCHANPSDPKLCFVPVKNRKDKYQKAPCFAPHACGYSAIGKVYTRLEKRRKR